MEINVNQILKLFLLILLSNSTILSAHNSHNGGCKDHCVIKLKTINKKNFKNINEQKILEYENSCLNKSLCRG